jgi:hypothetical protein
MIRGNLGCEESVGVLIFSTAVSTFYVPLLDAVRPWSNLLTYTVIILPALHITQSSYLLSHYINQSSYHPTHSSYHPVLKSPSPHCSYHLYQPVLISASAHITHISKLLSRISASAHIAHISQCSYQPVLNHPVLISPLARGADMS